MPATWLYPQIPPARVQGRGLAEDNFAQESRTGLEILIREALQNPLDARNGDEGGAVRVVLKHLKNDQFDTNFLRSLIDEEYVNRLDASKGEPAGVDFAAPAVLVIEDFGTTGLQGTFTDTAPDGDRENWNAFWFREGEGAKPGPGSNGRAGQGKITYYRTSGARAVFGLTIRASDKARLLMGRSSFRRTYVYGGTKYERDGFWCAVGGEHGETPIPEQDTEFLDAFCDAFGLARESDSGLSLVIPFPAEFNSEEAITTVISEFYYPVATGSLEVTVGDITITVENIDEIADRYFPESKAREKGSAFTKEYRGEFNRSTQHFAF